MEKKIAKINGKDISSDWIEEIFDEFLRYGDSGKHYLGVIQDVPCGCVVSSYAIVWWMDYYLDIEFKAVKAYNELHRRLRKKDEQDENVFSEFKTRHTNEKFVFTQTFYWRNPA